MTLDTENAQMIVGDASGQTSMSLMARQLQVARPLAFRVASNETSAISFGTETSEFVGFDTRAGKLVLGGQAVGRLLVGSPSTYFRSRSSLISWNDTLSFEANGENFLQFNASSLVATIGGRGGAAGSGSINLSIAAFVISH